MLRSFHAGRFLFFLFAIAWSGLGTRVQARVTADSTDTPPPKHELRGMWIATVENIDWPNQRGEAPEQYRRDYRRLLDAGQRAGINAVFVQIRPASDAFYKSTLEPWSKWLTGVQGKAPAGGDDPLPFLITEAHRRGMEFHAWFNPYRATMDSVTRRLAPSHPYRQHPQWFLRYGGQLLYNPGLPEVRAHITRVILDVVRRYDIDAVHFDDYFYPYPEPGQVFHDEAAFRDFNPDHFEKLADWRRNNVNVLIHDLHDSIRLTKRWVKFGISPFGVWMNKSADPLGSDTRAGQPSFSNLYADSRLWLEKGWIDYIVPQLYWSSNFRLVPYPILLEWWTRNHFDRHLYIGHGTYRMLESTRSDTTWRNPRELPRQIRLNRSYDGEAPGSVFFSAKSLLANPLHTTDSLRQNLFRYPALVPSMPWMDAVPPLPVANLTLRRLSHYVTLNWQPGPAAPDGDVATYYVLYRFEANERSTPNDPRRILALPRPAPGFPATFVDTAAVPGQAYAYYVTAVDRLHNESRPMRVITMGLQSTEIAQGQAPAGATSTGARPATVAAQPGMSRPQPRIVLRPNGTNESPEASTPFTKVKMKVKEKPKRRGFFAKLFGN
ncbi:family 10 glycosylhydrolase [Hymenobacter sp. BT770]|uniref:glycoside hydrolase family 10 protein n=1 Tax=Hymenobacter sp. BT770 TaxID=2886942 RepID=UPI001D100B94|nr:family 10 glycosylhydrolase [Hymenobacter sp. BT770]MCC3154271.1 family 10 glycosylhydrolase [Hymenobacter sp. BT770]MDO3416349.1 family 10 glycosylhydrolase [Hymenobacter sp. BT770]